MLPETSHPVPPTPTRLSQTPTPSPRPPAFLSVQRLLLPRRFGIQHSRFQLSKSHAQYKRRPRRACRKVGSASAAGCARARQLALRAPSCSHQCPSPGEARVRSTWSTRTVAQAVESCGRHTHRGWELKVSFRPSASHPLPSQSPRPGEALSFSTRPEQEHTSP